ncbi:MAG TPA: hypothetical protein VN039_14505, partial [Nitrospira sp.]|nr:hypothetical protein [Nitrospira sp.]
MIRIDDHRIRAYVRPPEECGEKGLVHHAHHVIKALVLSLNIASLGHFYWESCSSANPILSLTESLEPSGAKELMLVTRPPVPDFGQLRSFSPNDEYRSVMLFGVFARGSAHVLEDEYCRGLLLFHMQFCDIDFRRDAFMCFYRVLEHFITRRVLGKPRLQNELKDIQLCISRLGFDGDLADEMKELYLLRSGQTAHAQNTPRPITGDEVMKMKIFVDALLVKILLAEADGIMEKTHGSR